MVPRVHVLACGVLAADLRELAGRVPAQVTLDILPGKLHNTPHDLRRRLQERIDAVSAAGGADAIAVAYGICGRGTVGLAARVVPLWIPRVHDCIALFLGSDAAYREQFTREPGTYYVTAGWVEEGMGTGGACADPQRGAWQAQHGADNAAAIESFLGSWKRNYRRAAFIDTGIGDRHHAAVAQRLAAANGWRYEELPGSHALLEALLAGAEDERILHVPPGFTTRFDAAQRRLTASPPGGSSAPLPAAATVGRGEPRSTTAATVRREGLGLGIDAGGTYTDAAIFDWGAGRVLAKAKAPTTPWDYAVGIDAALEQLPAERLRQVSMVSVSTTLATNAIVEGRGQKVGLLLLPPLVEGQQVRSFGFTPTDALHLLGRMAFWDAGTARRFAALLGERAGLDGEATARAVLEAVVRRVARELLMARLSDLTGSRSTDGEHGFVARALLERGLGEKRDDLGVDLRLGRPVIGIGAPAGFFLPEACFRLHTEAVIPADGDVANAIGAIVSGVCVERSAEIRVDERGAYHVAGLPGAPSFGELPAAQAYAETALRAMVADLARQAGAAAPEVSLAARDRVTTVGDGEDLFIGRVLVARATGLPG